MADVLPLSSRPEFIPLPQDARHVSDGMRSAAFPGISTAAIWLGRAFVRSATSPLTLESKRADEPRCGSSEPRLKPTPVPAPSGEMSAKWA